MAQLTDHLRAEELFSAYIDQHVTADERAFVERHVAVCADCRAQLQATRSMVAALKAMPAVKAPRSFVLPKSMAVQPKPSIFSWYPAVRLATVFTAIAFVLVFTSDLLTVRQPINSNIIMSASAPAVEAPAAPVQAPAAAPLAKSAPAPQEPALSAPAPAGAVPVTGDVAPAMPTATADNAANVQAFSVSVAPTATLMAETVTDTVGATTTLAYDAVAATPEPAPEIAVEAPAPTVTASVPPAFDPLRLASIVLGGLVIVLGAAALIIRRGA